jgi:hypothetical protein
MEKVRNLFGRNKWCGAASFKAKARTLRAKAMAKDRTFEAKATNFCPPGALKLMPGLEDSSSDTNERYRCPQAAEATETATRSLDDMHSHTDVAI